MYNIPPKDPTADWEPALGRFVIAFTQVEYWLHVYVHALGSPELHRDTVDLPMGKRVKCIRNLLKERSLPATTLKLAMNVMDDAMALAGKRNLILHNPLLVDIYEKPNGELHGEMMVRSIRDATKFVTIEDVDVQCERVKALCVALSQLFAMVNSGAR